jgi:hypothetical protein
MPRLRKPDAPTFPFFVYGLLKPEELAFSLVEPFVTRLGRATARGTLRLRDGIPLFDPAADGQVTGWLLWFDQARLGEAWSAVSSFEPATQYEWLAVEARSGEEVIRANVLEGLLVDVGTAEESVQEWSSGRDPVFTEGLDEVRRLVREAAPGSVGTQPDTRQLWRTFFRLQAAYLLLWSIVERYTALRFGPAHRAGDRIALLGEDTAFRQAVVAAGAKPDVVVDSRDPGRSYPLAADGAGAADYFYGVRSNLSHRGKSAFKDAKLVYKAVTELDGAMRILLAQQLPAVDDAI